MNVIVEQPSIDSVQSAYAPIIFLYQVDITTNDSPVNFCDVYIYGIYFATTSRT